MRKKFWIRVLNDLTKDARFQRSALMVLMSLIFLEDRRPVRKTQEQLGDTIGLDRKTINKALGTLEKLNYIVMERPESGYGDARIPKISLIKS